MPFISLVLFSIMKSDIGSFASGSQREMFIFILFLCLMILHYGYISWNID